MDTDYFRKINNYLQYHGYNTFFGLVANNQLPASLQVYQFTVNNNNEVETTFENKVIKVVPPNDVDNTLQREYDNLQGITVGVLKFFNLIKSKYIGITRKQVNLFLNRQEHYQLRKQRARRYNKKINVKRNNECWAFDIVDMTSFGKRERYIFTCIDLFSRYVWALPCVTRTRAEIERKLDQIIASNGGIAPRRFLSDNAQEFKLSPAFYARHNNIFHVFSKPHSPTDNAISENFNGYLRKMINDKIVATGSDNWPQHLPDIVAVKNNLSVQSFKNILGGYYSANDMREIGLEGDARRSIRADTIQENVENARAVLDKRRFVVGDEVRIATDALYNAIRKRKKAGEFLTKVPITFTKNIFVVNHVVRSNNRTFQQEKYELRDIRSNTDVLEDYDVSDPQKIRKVRQFYYDELLWVPPNIVASNITNADTAKLMKIWVINYDNLDINQVPNVPTVYPTVSTNPPFINPQGLAVGPAVGNYPAPIQNRRRP